MKKLLLFAPFTALALEMDISYSPSYFKWKEPGMENKGWLHRVDFSLKQPFNKLVYGKLGASLFGGNVDYKGQTWGGTPVDSDTTYEGWEIKGLLGVDYPMSKQMKVGGYTGLAFRKWTRTSGGSLNAIGYTEKWHSLYAPLGFTLEYNVKPVTYYADAGLTFQIDNENYAPAFDVKTRPGKKVNPYIELGLKYSKLKLGVYYEKFDTGSSSYKYSPVVNDYLYQPSSKMDLYGVRLGLSF